MQVRGREGVTDWSVTTWVVRVVDGQMVGLVGGSRWGPRRAAAMLLTWGRAWKMGRAGAPDRVASGAAMRRG
jgi:hypothetical protein